MAKKKQSKQVEMPAPKWYAIYQGMVLLEDISRKNLMRLMDGNKTCREESYGDGPWRAIKAGSGCVVKRVPDGAVGPYLTPHIALAVAETLNKIAPQGIESASEKSVLSNHYATIKMELPT